MTDNPITPFSAQPIHTGLRMNAELPAEFTYLLLGHEATKVLMTHLYRCGKLDDEGKLLATLQFRGWLDDTCKAGPNTYVKGTDFYRREGDLLHLCDSAQDPPHRDTFINVGNGLWLAIESVNDYGIEGEVMVEGVYLIDGVLDTSFLMGITLTTKFLK